MFNKLPRLQAPRDEGNDLPNADTDVRGVDDEDFSALETDTTAHVDPEAAAENDKVKANRQAIATRKTGTGEGEGEGDGEDEGDGDDAVATEEDIPDANGELAEGVDAGEAKDTSTPKTKKGAFIPLDRHEKMLKKERARREQLEAQLEQSQAGRRMADTNTQLAGVEQELVELESKYNKLLADGDTDGATRVMTQIRHKNMEHQSISADAKEQEILARAVEQVRVNEAVERIEEEYPALDPQSDEFDAEMFQDVMDMLAVKKARGMSPTKALQAAVKQVMGVKGEAQRKAVTVQPRVSEADVAAERKAEAVKRNLAVAGKTPPSTHRTGAGNDEKGGQLTPKRLGEMSEKEFEALSDKELDKALGIS